MHVVKENNKSYNEQFIMKASKEISEQFNFNIIQQRALIDTLYRCTNNLEIIKLTQETGDFLSYLDIYVNAIKLEGQSEDTIRNKKYMLLELNRYLSKKIEDITLSDLKMYILHKQADCAANSLNGIIVCIKTFFNYLYEDDYIDNNPARKLKKIKEETRLRKSLSEITFEEIRSCCNNIRDKALIEFTYASGLRVSEISKLNISDLDFSSNEFSVIGKGKKERVVIFSNISKFYLQKYLDSRTDDNPALFVSLKRPYNRLSKRGIEKIFERIKKRLGLEEFYPHLLRHTMATRLAETADITTVQALLGHKNVNTTLIYAEKNNDKVAFQYKNSRL